MKLFAARFVLPVSSPPIERGAVAFENGTIIAVGEASELGNRFPEASFEDFGEAAILPGFVNCHSHLEITAMRGYLDRFDDDFSAWLLNLTKIRAERLSDEDIQNAAILGAVEGARAGVTTFGDIGRFGIHGMTALKSVGLRGVVFQETEFSPDDRTASDDFAKLEDKFWQLREAESELVRAALSPHSPYTVGPRLFNLITEFAVENDIALSIHAAESAMEDELLKQGTGFFVGVYEKFGFAWKSPDCSPVEYLASLGVLKAKPLLAHCIRVSESDIKLIAESGSRIAHCPKSNAKFGHGIAPFGEFLEAGISVGFGSDSVASNNTCDILEESRFATLFARNLPGRFLQPSEIIETATLGGARALGLEDEIGSLEVSKQADFAVVSLENPALLPLHDVENALVFSACGRDVCATFVNGEEVYRDGICKNVDETELKKKLRGI